MAFRTLPPASPRGIRFARMALLCLALVMALAQVAAVRHAYSHAPGHASTQSGGKHPGGLAHCEACIAAVALGAAAPPPSPLLFATLERQLLQPLAPVVDVFAPLPRHYAIRAPPAIAC